MNFHYRKSSEGNYFVGIKFVDKQPTIYFPHGYPVENEEKLPETEQKKDIRNLLTTLYATSSFLKFKTECPLVGESNFLYDCIFLIEDFLQNGLYKENITITSTQDSGKINWKQTIIKNVPIVSKTTDSYQLYFKNIYRNKTVTKENIITYIHIETIKIAVSYMGIFYPQFTLPTTPLSGIDLKKYKFIIEKMLSISYKDRNKALFKSILNIILEKDNTSSEKPLRIGVNDYEVVWENMLRRVYGNRNESDFFPLTCYTLMVNNQNTIKEEIFSTMRPDIIFTPDDREYFIIDAKYYHYCETYNIKDLPNSESVSKQIIYHQKIEEKLKQNNLFAGKNTIHNVFILPYNKDDQNLKSSMQIVSMNALSSLAFKGFAIIKAQISIKTDPYKIVLAFKDTKELINEYCGGTKYCYKTQYQNLVDMICEYNNFISLITKTT